MRCWLAAVIVTCATCGAPERSTPEPEKPAPAPARSFPTGLFAITSARTVSDHCDNRLRFVTKLLEIDLTNSSVLSDPDSRIYEAVLEGKTLVARGAFDQDNLCKTFKHLEIWRLDAQGDDEISGYRTTFWRDPSRNRNADCLQACKVVYAVEAVRTDPDAEDAEDAEGE